MMPVQAAQDPTPVLYRIGRLADSLAWPEWRYCGGGRFDDPQRVFRTIYAAEQRLACFVELLATFRPSPQVLSMLKAVANVDEPLVLGIVPADWVRKRSLGAFRARPGQHWLDLRAFSTREALRGELAEQLAQLGLSDLDVSAVRGPQRELTQAIARWAYMHGFAGLVYRSRFDDSLGCWAVFEGAEFDPVGIPEPISLGDADLLAAAALFGLCVDR